MIELSIVTVTKNCSVTIQRTLDSIKAIREIKTLNIEYIVIDGDSKDLTLEILNKNKVVIDILVSEPDSGIFNAMNKAIDLASGKYILFINGDDELVSEGFPIILPILKNGRRDIVCATTIAVSNGGIEYNLSASPWKLFFFNSIPHPSTFIKLDILKKYRFREDLKIASDYDLFLRLFVDKFRFTKIKVITSKHYRGGASSNSALSTIETNQIRLCRLGTIKYRFLNIIWKTYRKLKFIFQSNKI
jgi:glycosyltransferase involved in cell wall biosynthesis